MRRSRVSSHRRVTHKSTGGILKHLPEPVDPVGNAPNYLTTNTVAPFDEAFSLSGVGYFRRQEDPPKSVPPDVAF